MAETLSRKYNRREIEDRWHRKWREEKVYSFNPDSQKEAYSIDTPPPFTSGTLHMGHIYNHVWIDIAARYKRMRGYEVYFPQGFDCHGLPTELRVEKEKGVRKEDRERFIEECVKWTHKAVERMKSQFDAVGYSCDWNYTYKTMDDTYKALVQRTLLDFYERGLLYREKHPVLWCPRCETALAKAEVGHVEREGKLYYIDLDSEGHKLTIATTRPEMMPACVAVFVHPEDKRYKKFVGKKAKLPIFNREVPILADDEVDMEFGTGVVYLCTFGDEQDIRWQRKYQLPVIEAIDKRGRLTHVAGKYKDLDAGEARKMICEDLVEDGHIRKIEKITHSVLSHTERSSCKHPIELLPLKQWFIEVKKFTQDIIMASKEMNWYPQYMLQRLVDWSEAMDWDWIISRQRVFGTPIPFWVCECGAIIPADGELPTDPRGTSRECEACGKKALGEEDVCDCWVDSSVTPLVISRWNSDMGFFEKTYPCSLRPQGYEIIRTWAFYTIFRSLILTGMPCFRELLINGMVAGPDGRKMSKSLGNVVEPEEPLKKYSADTLRQWAANGTLGDDYPFSWEECDHSERFLTKLWNISRFIQMHLEDFKEGKTPQLREIDLWILSLLQELIDETTSNMDNYVFNIPMERTRSFMWHELADNYLEMVKHRLYKPEVYGEESRYAAQYTLNTILKNILKLLAPYTPHICEELWDNIYGKGYVTVSKWPTPDKKLISEEAKESGELAKRLVGEVRRYKSENGIPLAKEIEKVKIYVNKDLASTIEKIREDIKATGKINKLDVEVSDIEEFAVEITC